MAHLRLVSTITDLATFCSPRPKGAFYWNTKLLLSYNVHHKKYAHSLPFVVFCSWLASVNFSHVSFTKDCALTFRNLMILRFHQANDATLRPNVLSFSERLVYVSIFPACQWRRGMNWTFTNNLQCVLDKKISYFWSLNVYGYLCEITTILHRVEYLKTPGAFHGIMFSTYTCMYHLTCNHNPAWYCKEHYLIVQVKWK